MHIREQLQKIREKVNETKEEFKKLTHDLLEQVSQSKDEVSKVLAGLFSQAVAPNEGELQRARARKERGNPPGKKSDPLGDELSWEQGLLRRHIGQCAQGDARSREMRFGRVRGWLCRNTDSLGHTMGLWR